MHIWKTMVLALSQIVLVATKRDVQRWPCPGRWTGRRYPGGYCVASFADCQYPMWTERDNSGLCPDTVALHELQQWLIIASILLCERREQRNR